MNLTIPIPKRVLDIFEQAVVFLLYAWMIARLWPDDFSSPNWYLLLILFSEGIVVVLLVFRRRTERISVNLADWAVAFGGTFAVLLIAKGNDPITAVGGVSLLLIGLCVHVAAKLMLLRSFGLVAADRGVKSGGLYAVVRHPMYLGYLLTHIGYLLVAPSVWNVMVYLLAWLMMIARIYAEERVLDANPDYQAFKARVRYRLLPGIF
ncbi:MAG: isoprenylcysteine carboxylmethyltransferase family protein [Gammaproteobacteria bacterium]|nr:isoprenylcysteine carboxylmethyltransferase family protein [Gammaproteobacteria bacterium]